MTTETIKQPKLREVRVINSDNSNKVLMLVFTPDILWVFKGINFTGLNMVKMRDSGYLSKENDIRFMNDKWYFSYRDDCKLFGPHWIKIESEKTNRLDPEMLATANLLMG